MSNDTENKYLINQELIRLSSQRSKMPFEKMKRGDCFWVIGHEKVSTKFQDQQSVWYTCFEEPSHSPEEGCLINDHEEYMFYQGAATTWMSKLPQELLTKLHQCKLCFELEFLDITLKGCFRLKATGRQIDVDHPSTTDVM
jgi:hypothetical protein